MAGFRRMHEERLAGGAGVSRYHDHDTDYHHQHACYLGSWQRPDRLKSRRLVGAPSKLPQVLVN